MLNLTELTNQITEAWRNTVPPALEVCVKELLGENGKMQDYAAENFKNTFDELTSDTIGELIATAIDYYIKNMDITGKVITVGNAFTQTAPIVAPPMPSMGGKIPNTLGIS